MSGDYEYVCDLLKTGTTGELEELAELVDGFPDGQDAFVGRRWILTAIDSGRPDRYEILERVPRVSLLRKRRNACKPETLPPNCDPIVYSVPAECPRVLRQINSMMVGVTWKTRDAEARSRFPRISRDS